MTGGDTVIPRLTPPAISRALSPLRHPATLIAGSIFIRPLLKLATESQMPGDLGTQNRNVFNIFNIHEDLSTKSTTQLIKTVEFPKKSNTKIKHIAQKGIIDQFDVCAGLLVARPKGFEPLTHRLEICCSIHWAKGAMIYLQLYTVNSNNAYLSRTMDH